MSDFGTLCTGNLEHTGLPSYADLPNADAKSQLLTSLPISWEKCFSIGKLSNSWWWITFSKTLIFSWKLQFYHRQQILIFPEVTDSYHSFLRKYLPNTRIWITVVCHFFIQIIKKVLQSGLFSSQFKYSHKCFHIFLENMKPAYFSM